MPEEPTIIERRDVMQEESSAKTVALVIRAVKFTEEVFRRAIIAYIKERLNTPLPEKHGKMTVRELLGKDQGANTLEINNGNISLFDRVASKYNIDYAIKKDITEDPPKYVLFFKARDNDVIIRAFKDYCDLNEKRSERKSILERLHKHRDKPPVSLDKEKILEKKKVKDMEAAL